MKAISAALFTLLLFASCTKEADHPIVGQYDATDGLNAWEWKFDADGKVWEKMGDVGGCGEYWEANELFVVSSGMFGAHFKGELIGNNDGFTLKGETITIKLKRK